MKKTLFAIVMCLSLSVSTYSAMVVGKYHLRYFNKTYNIEASETNVGFWVSIQVSTTRKDETLRLDIHSTDLEEFKQTLLQVKNKYKEWSKIAIDNNVSNMSKEIDVDFSSAGVQVKRPNSSYRKKVYPQFSFIVTKNGHCLVATRITVRFHEHYSLESLYGYSTNPTFEWIFVEPKEIDELISQLDYNAIKEQLELFK